MFVLPEIKPSEVLIYLRKSRTDDPSLSVSETVSRHEQMLDEYCMRTWGALIPEQNRFREIVSGETIEARPEVQKVLHLIERPEYKAVLIVEPQRLSRGDLEDIGHLVKIFRYTGTLIITLQGAFDLTDERDRDYFGRELMRGNDYLEYTRRIMQNGLRLCVEQGWYVGSQPPFGYRKVTVKDGKRNVHTLEPIEAEADAVLMMFRMYADGNGAAAICQALNDSGVPPRHADIWRPPVIYRILDNPHYIGLVRYDHRKLQKVVVDGKLKKQRATRKDAPLDEGRHPAIIPKELWDVAQQARHARHLPPVRSHLDIQNPLAGIVYCECGGVMVKAAQTKGRGMRIHCKDQIHCGNAGCTIDILLNQIAVQLRMELADISIKSETDSEQTDAVAGRIKMLTARKEALTAKQDALWEKLAEGMPSDTFDRLLEKNQREIASCSNALTDAICAADRAASTDILSTSLHAAIDAIQRNDAPVKELNSLLRSVISRVTYRRERSYHDADGHVIRPDPVIQLELRYF